MGAIQWLDFSSAERDDVLDLLAVQQEKGTLDELGLGVVRDAISDHLFPGLSTIQTRAKYFLFVPWMLRELETRRTGEDSFADRLDLWERQLIKALREPPGVPREPGLIGRESGDDTKRLPSAIYWNGLRQLGIFKGGASLAEYLQELPATRRTLKAAQVEPEGSEAADMPESQSEWDAGLPNAEDDFRTRSEFRLLPDQAQYLKEKILSMRPCVLQWMVLHLSANEVEALETPWQLRTKNGPRLPESLHAELTHALYFSLCGRVLTAAYYCRLVLQRPVAGVDFQQALDNAVLELQPHAAGLDAWTADMQTFWSWVARINPRLTRDRPFIEDWIRLLAKRHFTWTADNLLAAVPWRDFADRERRLKGFDAARLSNNAALQRWNPTDGDVGLMNFRWGTARQIVSDILRGLGRVEAPSHA